MFTTTRNDLSTVGDYHVKLGTDFFDYRIDRGCIGFWRRRRHGRQHCENPVCSVLGAFLCRPDNGSPRPGDVIGKQSD